MTINKAVTFKVNGMHCGGCANKIKKSIEELGVEQNTDVNVGEGTVKVQFDGNATSASELKAKVTAVGFQVESMSLE
jgi:copper chaperone CopZ